MLRLLWRLLRLPFVIESTAREHERRQAQRVERNARQTSSASLDVCDEPEHEEHVTSLHGHAR